jgi:transcriptional regulator with XRE-family HTH domain
MAKAKAKTKAKAKPVSSVGDELRQLIEAHASGRSLSAIAKDAGMSPQQLDGILNGDRPTPRIETIHRILSAIGIHECWACGGTGRQPGK